MRQADPITSNAACEPGEAEKLMELRIHKMDGEEFVLSVRPAEKIADVIARLSEQSGIEAYRIQLAQGAQKLRASATVHESGVQSDVPLFILVGGHCPEYARARGLSSEHPTLLREWFSRHQLEEPDWLQADEAVWQKLEEELTDRERRKARLEAWETHASLALPSGEPASLFRARPGETVHCRAEVWTHNRGGDSCIHQGLLGMDSVLAAELCDGVPGTGRRSIKNLKLKAPAEPGAYMLWTHVELQYRMADALRNFAASCQQRHAKAYPRHFVGWLVVEAAAG